MAVGGSGGFSGGLGLTTDATTATKNDAGTMFARPQVQARAWKRKPLLPASTHRRIMAKHRRAASPPVTADDPRVVLFAELEGMAEQLLGAAETFGQIAVAFANQVQLAKAIREAGDGRVKN